MKGMFVTFYLTHPDSNIIFSCVVCFLTTHISKSRKLLLTSAPDSLNHSLLTFNDRERLGADSLSCSSDELL